MGERAPGEIIAETVEAYRGSPFRRIAEKTLSALEREGYLVVDTSDLNATDIRTAANKPVLRALQSEWFYSFDPWNGRR